MPASMPTTTAPPVSIPCLPFWAGNSFRLAVIFHGVAFILFTPTGILMHLNGWYYAGIIITGAALFYQHLIVKPQDLSRIRQSFFSMNGLIALTLFIATCLSLATS